MSARVIVNYKLTLGRFLVYSLIHHKLFEILFIFICGCLYIPKHYQLLLLLLLVSC